MKKGQIAIEYLMTYGWAILLLVIVIGVISTMFSPSFLVAEQCNIDKNNLPCNAQVYNEGGDLKIAIRIVNGFGYPVKFDQNNIEFTLDDGTVVLGTIQGNAVVEQGEDIIIRGIFAGKEKSPNSLASINVYIKYLSCAHEINPECNDNDDFKYEKTGKIVGRVMQ
ncbi:MAG: hypothetical protein PHU63_02765 [Candidatus ainarchaeum sp.]|nr:hypothetical protein [Candidatus ainarchaeum sp.]